MVCLCNVPFKSFFTCKVSVCSNFKCVISVCLNISCLVVCYIKGNCKSVKRNSYILCLFSSIIGKCSIKCYGCSFDRFLCDCNIYLNRICVVVVSITEYLIPYLVGVCVCTCWNCIYPSSIIKAVFKCTAICNTCCYKLLCCFAISKCICTRNGCNA